jgi:hypothetical protein
LRLRLSYLLRLRRSMATRFATRRRIVRYTTVRCITGPCTTAVPITVRCTTGRRRAIVRSTTAEPMMD